MTLLTDFRPNPKYNLYSEAQCFPKRVNASLTGAEINTYIHQACFRREVFTQSLHRISQKVKSNTSEEVAAFGQLPYSNVYYGQNTVSSVGNIPKLDSSCLENISEPAETLTIKGRQKS